MLTCVLASDLDETEMLTPVLVDEDRTDFIHCCHQTTRAFKSLIQLTPPPFPNSRTHGRFPPPNHSQQYMMLESAVDYETASAFTLTVTCVDAIDEGLTTTIPCDIVVVDVAEAPILTGWSYTAGAISETTVRTVALSVGTMTALDQDFYSGTSGIVISFAVRLCPVKSAKQIKPHFIAHAGSRLLPRLAEGRAHVKTHHDCSMSPSPFMGVYCLDQLTHAAKTRAVIITRAVDQLVLAILACAVGPVTAITVFCALRHT